MLYTAEFTIPANTSSSAPASQILKVAQGVITEISVTPWPPSAGQTHMVIRYHEHQIAPSTEGMTLCGDTFPIDWDEYLELDQPPYELKLEGWNDDDFFPHTFYVAVAVLPRALTLRQAIADAFKSLLSIFSPKRIFTGGA